jgi:hypothetical protein
LGIKIGDKRIPALMYADDIILIAPTRRSLQALCNITEEWAFKYGLELNTEKTEYIVFGSNEFTG